MPAARRVAVGEEEAWDASRSLRWEWTGSGVVETAGRHRVGRGMDWVTGTWTRTGYAII
jgi:hypothetical protein